jgi:hypothetical protein
MRCRLYIDEVGNADLKGSAHDDNIRYLSLTGVITAVKLHDTEFVPALDALKATYFPDHSAANPVLLHRKDIMNRKGPFRVLHNEENRTKFSADLLEVLNKLPYRAITVTIDKRQHLERYTVWNFDPYHYCMRCLVERYVRWLDDRGPEFTGDVVAEARYKQVDKKLKASFARIYKEGTENVPARMAQQRLTSNDIKLYPKKDNVAGLQIADLIAHPSWRAMRQDRDGVQRPNDFGTQVVGILEAAKYRRSHYNGRVAGWDIKWLP